MNEGVGEINGINSKFKTICEEEMLENATVSSWRPWGTMPFCTELSGVGPPHYDYFDVGTLF